jgi:hypothetical protein
VGGAYHVIIELQAVFPPASFSAGEFFCRTVFGFYIPTTVAWKNGKSYVTKWAKLFFHHTAFRFYFPNTVPWKNGKSQITKWAELFFKSIFFSAGEFFLRASFFCGRFFSAYSIWVFLFFHSTENGRKPRWIFTPTYLNRLTKL